MAKQGQTIKQANREVRQETHRELLSNQKHIEKVIDNIQEIEGLNFFVKGDNNEIDYKLCQANKFRMDALKIANEQRLKLVNKYLPDLKNIELANDGGGQLTINVTNYE